jgi:hypothetical protein
MLNRYVREFQSIGNHRVADFLRAHAFNQPTQLDARDLDSTTAFLPKIMRRAEFLPG